MIYFGKAARNLGPSYYCPACTRPEKDLTARPVQCPDCELSRLYQKHLARIQEQAIELHGDAHTRPCWPFADCSMERALRFYDYVQMALTVSDGKIAPDWDELTVRLALIVQQERDHARSSDLWNEEQQLRFLRSQNAK